MGLHDVSAELHEAQRRAFTRALIADLRALEEMIEGGLIERGVRRIGAEQEMFLVRPDLRPAPVAMDVLARAADPRLTTEIARFNLEANLTPRPLAGRCLSALAAELGELLGLVDEAARPLPAEALLTGILPTLTLEDLGPRSMTPCPRYLRMAEALRELRGGDFAVHIEGLDELQLRHPSVMLEACNTSFQLHLQVDAADFARLYNWAQAISAPLLAAAANSPILLGRRLWHETRVALFQHATDGRSAAELARGQRPRVYFGDRWVERSPLELFREDAARFRLLLCTEEPEDPFGALRRGAAPRLDALCLHSGTIWRWNRACYGVTEGRPHLRIENRVLPAGPTILDEVANAALFYGLMLALPAQEGEVSARLPFSAAQHNFVAAAREGLRARLAWLDGRSLPARDLLWDQLLPAAREGLRGADLDRGDIDLYLGVIEQRVRAEQTGAEWQLGAYAALPPGPEPDRARQLTAALRRRQREGGPVHAWPLPRPDELGGRAERGDVAALLVRDIMSTDLFTVRPEDAVDLAVEGMWWRRVRHVPVEDAEGRLLGVLSHRDLLHALARSLQGGAPRPVREIMALAPLVATPQMALLDAVALMLRHGVGCLPVVEPERGRLVGIVTERDVLPVAERLLRAQAGADADTHATGER